MLRTSVTTFTGHAESKAAVIDAFPGRRTAALRLYVSPETTSTYTNYNFMSHTLYSGPWVLCGSQLWILSWSFYNLFYELNIFLLLIYIMESILLSRAALLILPFIPPHLLVCLNTSRAENTPWPCCLDAWLTVKCWTARALSGSCCCCCSHCKLAAHSRQADKQAGPDDEGILSSLRYLLMITFLAVFPSVGLKCMCSSSHRNLSCGSTDVVKKLSYWITGVISIKVNIHLLLSSLLLASS